MVTPVEREGNYFIGYFECGAFFIRFSPARPGEFGSNLGSNVRQTFRER
jgi:hypothetical protein